MQALSSGRPRFVALWPFALLAAACFTPNAAAVPIFSENFESYAAGSNLKGQGGWAEWFPNGTSSSVLTVANGTFLSSRVLDGRAATGVGQQNIVLHSLPINPSAVTTLLFDAYATTSSLRTHNGGVGVGPFGAGEYDLVDWFAASFSGPPRWAFDVLGEVFAINGGFDRPVTMGIVIDGPASQVYGLYDFGGGFQQTPRFTLTRDQIASLGSVQIQMDNRDRRFYTGMEVDNLRAFDDASVVPEPSSLSLLCAGTAAVFLGGRSRRLIGKASKTALPQ